MAFIFKEGTTGGEGTDAAIEASITTWLTSKGLTVRTSTQDEQFTQAKIDEAFGRRNTELDTTILEATAVPKANGEKYYDYLKRAVGLKITESANLKREIEELKRSNPESDKIKELRDQLKTVMETSATLKADHEKELARLKSESFNDRVNKELDSAIGKLQFKKLSEDEAENKALTEDLVKVRKAKFLEEHTPHESDGRIVFKDKAGNIIRDRSNGHPELTDTLIKPAFETLISKGREQGGADSGGQGAGAGGAGGGSGAKDWKTIKRPDTIKSQVELTRWLSGQDHKLDPNSKEFSDAFAVLAKDPNAPGGMLPVKPS